MFSHFDTMHTCDRQRDRHMELPWHILATAYMLSCVKINADRQLSHFSNAADSPTTGLCPYNCHRLISASCKPFLSVIIIYVAAKATYIRLLLWQNGGFSALAP